MKFKKLTYKGFVFSVTDTPDRYHKKRLSMSSVKRPEILYLIAHRENDPWDPPAKSLFLFVEHHLYVSPQETFIAHYKTGVSYNARGSHSMIIEYHNVVCFLDEETIMIPKQHSEKLHFTIEDRVPLLEFFEEQSACFRLARKFNV